GGDCFEVDAPGSVCGGRVANDTVPCDDDRAAHFGRAADGDGGRCLAAIDYVVTRHIIDLWRGGYRGAHADSLSICGAGIACGVVCGGADGVRAVVDLICRGADVGGREGDAPGSACGGSAAGDAVPCDGDRTPGFGCATHNHSIGCFVSIDRVVTRDGLVDLRRIRQHAIDRELIADDRGASGGQDPDGGRCTFRDAAGRHCAGTRRGRSRVDRPVAVAVRNRVEGDGAAAGDVQRDRDLGA